MLAPLIFALAATAPVPLPAPAPAAPVKVWLSSKGDFFVGEKAKAYVRAAEDGYLVVLHADSRGRVRVLFPIDPNGDQFVRGDKKYELKGRGDREAFLAADSGRGAVFAAWSKGRFATEKFTQNGHWDFRALAIDTATADPEAALMDKVAAMQSNEQYSYDVATYIVTDPRYARGYRRGPMPVWGGGGWFGRGNVAVSIGLGRGFYGRSYYYDPFYYGYGFPYSYGFPIRRWYW
jgi:hypothetical protein